MSLCENTEGKYFPVQTEQTRLSHLLLAFGSFSYLFVVLRLPASDVNDVAVYLTFELVRFKITSFYKKETLIFQDVLAFDIFQRIYIILFYFHSNHLRNVPAQTCRSLKKV